MLHPAKNTRTKPTMNHHHAPFEIIDNALEPYYISNGLSYRDASGKGLFLKWINEEEFNDSESDIDTELRTGFDPNNCPYSDFINHNVFPIPRYAVIPNTHKEIFASHIIKYCYNSNQAPSPIYIQNEILHKVGGRLTPIFTSVNTDARSDSTEATEANPWNETMYMLHLKCNGNTMYIRYFTEIIKYCIENKYDIHNVDGIGIQALIGSFEASQNQKDIYQSFQESLDTVMQKLRGNEIASEVDSERCRMYPKIIKTLQRMSPTGDHEMAAFQDKTLNAFFIAFGFNMGLVIMDLFSKIQCQCINHHRYDVMDNKWFITRCNSYIRYNILHYTEGVSQAPYMECVKVMKVIQKRFMTSTHYFAMIRNKELENEQRKGDIDDEKSICSDDTMNYNLRALQILFFALSVSFSKHASLLSSETNSTVIYRIPSFVCNVTECASFADSMDEYVAEFDEIFTHDAFTKNMKQGKIGDCVVNKKHVHMEYIDGDNIHISCTDKEHDAYYANNHVYHIVKTKRMFTKGIGIAVHMFGDTMKMYWHCYGSMLPLTLKDIICSKWWKLQFNNIDYNNALNETDWNEIKRYLMDVVPKYALSLDHELESIFIALAERMYNSYLFEDILKSIYADRIQQPEEHEHKSQPMSTFASRYGTKITLDIPDNTVQCLAFDSKKQFGNNGVLRAYIYSVVRIQIKSNEMRLIGSSKAIFDIGVRHRDTDTLLYGMLELKDNRWCFNEYHTAKKMQTYIGGNVQLPQINKYNVNVSKNEDIDHDVMKLGQDIIQTGLVDRNQLDLQTVQRMYVEVNNDEGMVMKESRAQPQINSIEGRLGNDNNDGSQYSGSFESGTSMYVQTMSSSAGNEVNEDGIESRMLNEQIIMDIEQILDEEMVNLREYFEPNGNDDYMAVFIECFFDPCEYDWDDSVYTDTESECGTEYIGSFRSGTPMDSPD